MPSPAPKHSNPQDPLPCCGFCRTCSRPMRLCGGGSSHWGNFSQQSGTICRGSSWRSRAQALVRWNRCCWDDNVYFHLEGVFYCRREATGRQTVLKRGYQAPLRGQQPPLWLAIYFSCWANISHCLGNNRVHWMAEIAHALLCVVFCPVTTLHCQNATSISRWPFYLPLGVQEIRVSLSQGNR